MGPVARSLLSGLQATATTAGCPARGSPLWRSYSDSPLTTGFHRYLCASADSVRIFAMKPGDRRERIGLAAKSDKLPVKALRLDSSDRMPATCEMDKRIITGCGFRFGWCDRRSSLLAPAKAAVSGRGTSSRELPERRRRSRGGSGCALPRLPPPRAFFDIRAQNLRNQEVSLGFNFVSIAQA